MHSTAFRLLDSGCLTNGPSLAGANNKLSSSGPGPGPRSGPGQVPGQVHKVQGLRTKDLDLG